MFEFMKSILEKIDNDTIIVLGLIGIAFAYAFQEQGDTQIVSNIVSIFGGYIGGQYVAMKKE